MKARNADGYQQAGVFLFLDTIEGSKIATLAREVERLGYSTMWVVEAAGRNSLALAAWLLARTDSLYIGNGLANLRCKSHLVDGQGVCRAKY